MGHQYIFVTDLHGSEERCRKLFEFIADSRPQAVFWGGDIFPSAFHDIIQSKPEHGNFIESFLTPELIRLKNGMGERYPKIFIIMGNDDPMIYEGSLRIAETAGLLNYVHSRHLDFGPYQVFGYSFVPPTPFQLKDWEKYDVSRHTDPGCVSPEEGIRSVKSNENPRYETIEKDLVMLTADTDLSDSIFLFHSPPYRTNLDRADLDGRMVDHVPVDVNVGSIAMSRFIEKRQPLLTLHGHVHESTRLTGSWRDKIGRTHMFSAAHDGPELAVVKFDLNDLENATRELI